MTDVSNITFIDIDLCNTSYIGPSQEYSMFSFEQSESLVISTLVAQKHQGSMFVIHNIVSMNISDCNFTGLSTSTNSTNEAQVFLKIIVDDTLGEEGVVMLFENFNVNVLPRLRLLLIS